jgi:hypothetical protein
VRAPLSSSGVIFAHMPAYGEESGIRVVRVVNCYVKYSLVKNILRIGYCFQCSTETENRSHIVGVSIPRAKGVFVCF